MDTFPLLAGTALALDVQLNDALGRPVAAYSPATPLAAVAWPGGGRAASFAVDAAWLDAPAGQLTLFVGPAATLTLAAGRYRGEVTAFDPRRGPQVVYEWAIDLQAAPGQVPEPPSYCGYADLLTYARSWLPTLAGADDEAGFAAQRGRARSWLDDLILSRYPRNGYLSALGSPGYGQLVQAGGYNTPNTYLRALLDQDLLIVRGWVVEACAKRALGLICAGQVGLGEQAADYARLGRMYAAEALAIALCNAAEIATSPAVPQGAGLPAVPQGPTSFAVNLGGGSLR